MSWQVAPGRTASTLPAARAAYRAGGVGAIPEHEATEVEHHRIAGLDDPVTRLVVRIGAVRTGSDDGEADLLVPEPPQELGEIGGDVGLPAACETALHDLAVRG